MRRVKGRKLALRIEFTRQTLSWALAGFVACALVYGALSDTMVMHTWWPPPLGIYSTFFTTGQAALARDGGNIIVSIDSKKNPWANNAKFNVVVTRNSQSPLNVLDSTGNSLLFIDKNGNVGIKNTSPQAALDVADQNGVGAIRLGAQPAGACATGVIAMVNNQPSWCDASGNWEAL